MLNWSYTASCFSFRYQVLPVQLYRRPEEAHRGLEQRSVLTRQVRTYSETHIEIQATRHDCLPSWMSDRDKWSEKVSGEDKISCTVPTRAANAGQKSLVPSEHNEPTKEGPLSYVLLESPFASVSTASSGHPSLCSLSGYIAQRKKNTIQKTIQIPTLKDSVVTVRRLLIQGFLWFSAQWKNTQ